MKGCYIVPRCKHGFRSNRLHGLVKSTSPTLWWHRNKSWASQKQRTTWRCWFSHTKIRWKGFYLGKPKEPSKEEIMAAMKDKESNCKFRVLWTIQHLYNFSFLLYLKVDGYEEKIESLVNEVAEHKEEIAKLRSTIQGMTK